jgi:hypothetical protein
MIGGGNPYIEKAVQGSKVLFFFYSTNNQILTHNLVYTVCKARGQDPRIALKLEGLANAEENAKVVQVDYRSIDMSTVFRCRFVSLNN